MREHLLSMLKALGLFLSPKAETYWLVNSKRKRWLIAYNTLLFKFVSLF